MFALPRPVRILAAALVVFGGISYLACTDGSSAVKEAPVTPDAGIAPDTGTPTGTDAGFESGSSDCFTNPTTSFEIINACTDAVRIAKAPMLPRLYPDGGLPPAP